jgi:hypothetical protein
VESAASVGAGVALAATVTSSELEGCFEWLRLPLDSASDGEAEASEADAAMDGAKLGRLLWWGGEAKLLGLRECEPTPLRLGVFECAGLALEGREGTPPAAIAAAAAALVSGLVSVAELGLRE